jgi:hypothetical protein
MAAVWGRLEVLKWARANGCPWSRNIRELALESHNAAVIEWVNANGAP